MAYAKRTATSGTSPTRPRQKMDTTPTFDMSGADHTGGTTVYGYKKGGKVRMRGHGCEMKGNKGKYRS